MLLPVLARLPQPLALLEVGASAGLCLYPDCYSYRYDDRPEVVGRYGRAVELAFRTGGGVPIPDRVPQVLWRPGST